MGTALLNTVGRNLMAWIHTSVESDDRLVISADGVLDLIALDALQVDGTL